MYEAFYKLTEDPFSLTPDRRFVFQHRSYKEAKNSFAYALNRAEGISVITGEFGTGKTTLINDLVADLVTRDYVVARLEGRQLNAKEPLRKIGTSFGLDAETDSRAMMLRELQHFLFNNYKASRITLLIIDEAQALSLKVLQEIHVLTNWQIKGQALLQLLLTGQEQLWDALRRPDMEQLHQRLISASHLEPLVIDETEGYLKQRLRIAGWKGDPTISDDAFPVIHKSSLGIPRQINILCHRLLVDGCIKKRHKLDASDVRYSIVKLSEQQATSLKDTVWPNSRSAQVEPHSPTVIEDKKPRARVGAVVGESFSRDRSPALAYLRRAKKVLIGAGVSAALAFLIVAGILLQPILTKFQTSPSVGDKTAWSLSPLAGISQREQPEISSDGEAVQPRQMQAQDNVAQDEERSTTEIPRLDLKQNQAGTRTVPASEKTIEQTPVVEGLAPSENEYAQNRQNQQPENVSMRSGSKSGQLPEITQLDSPTQGHKVEDKSHLVMQESQIQSNETASQAPQVDRRLIDLLALAKRQIAAERLSSPPSDNALQTYHQVLQLAPEHEGAQKGIARIKALYTRWADTAMEKTDWHRAQIYLEKALAIDPMDNTLTHTLARVRAEIESVEEEAKRTAQKDIATTAKADTQFSQQPPHKLSSVVNRIAHVEHEINATQDPALVFIRAEITGAVNRAEVFIETRQGFRPHIMHDDGAHGDRVAGDSEYGTQINLDVTHRPTHYYVAAYSEENHLLYSPARPEMQTYVIKPLTNKIKLPLIINEFMASNDQTIADPQGDYDDWIELYNTTSKAIDLSGYYLSNDPNNPKKWRFPDGTWIAGHAYLLIWADRGSSYTSVASNSKELHTNFRLSRRGDQILLVDTDESDNAVLDTVTFGPQREDISTGRIPNGAGKFTTLRKATPGWTN